MTQALDQQDSVSTLADESEIVEASAAALRNRRPLKDARLKEAAKLGFTRAFVPESARGEGGDAPMALTGVGPLIGLASEIAAQGKRRSAGSRAVGGS